MHASMLCTRTSRDMYCICAELVQVSCRKRGVFYRALCRVPKALPSVFYRALDKDGICRVPNKIHSAKKKHSTKCVFAECLFSDTRQRCILPSAIFRHTAKYVFAECLFSGTRQRCILPSDIFWHSAKRHFTVCIFLALSKLFF